MENPYEIKVVNTGKDISGVSDQTELVGCFLIDYGSCTTDHPGCIID